MLRSLRHLRLPAVLSLACALLVAVPSARGEKQSQAQPQAKGQEKDSIIADPMFVNPAKGDYRLKAGSPVYGLGFKPIPFERIGRRGWK